MIIEFNFQPTVKQLRQFGVVCLVALPLIGWLWFRDFSIVAQFALAGAIAAACGWLCPPLLKPFFVGLMVVTAPIGMVIAELSLLVIFFLIFLPIGLMFRILNRDRLQRAWDKNLPSYWQKKPQPKSIGHYYRQS